ncbi:hypothetical protein HOLDEFILI_02284 [Holdemania filiformis DSM 12042]|uniref:Uncharacterized protein n=1 Tax=Holdemania filiformis DSM 12042 TaxID=545696 RepID=B9Y8Y5_9FIRM|nr:hypothetical protein HOLDEFILI_02284 [Holdemania filiformis DSM 12042]
MQSSNVTISFPPSNGIESDQAEDSLPDRHSSFFYCSLKSGCFTDFA